MRNDAQMRTEEASVPAGLHECHATNFGGVTVGHVIPGFNCPTCDPTHAAVDRQNGGLLRAGLNAVAPRADLVLLEGLVNVDENAEFVETLTWGRTYLDIVRWFATIAP